MKRWYVDGHRMESEQGTFFIMVRPNGRAHALRLWDKEPEQKHEWIAPDGSFTYAEFPDAEAAMRECDARLAELESRCECGAALACFAGAGASGVLCPRCDDEHASELLEVDP